MNPYPTDNRRRHEALGVGSGPSILGPASSLVSQNSYIPVDPYAVSAPAYQQVSQDQDTFADLKEINVKVQFLKGGLETRPGYTGADKTDPYVTIRLENDRNEAGKIFRTTTKENAGKDATWNENFTIPYLKGFDKMRVEIWDANHVTKDEFLGFNEVFLRSTHGRGQGRPTEEEVSLYKDPRAATGFAGVVTMTVSFVKTPRPQTSHTSGNDPLNSIKEFVVSVLELQGGPAKAGDGTFYRDTTDPFVKVNIQDGTGRNSSKIESTEVINNAGANAKWTRNNTFTIPNTPGREFLKLQLFDSDFGKENFLAAQEVSLRTLIQQKPAQSPSVETRVTLVSKNGSPSGNLTVSVKFVQNFVNATTGSRLEVKVVRLEGAPKTRDIIDKLDPYIAVNLQDSSGRNKGIVAKTSPMPNAGGDVTFRDPPFVLPCVPGQDMLHVELWDDESFRKDELVGFSNTPISSLCVPNSRVLRTVDLQEKGKFCGRVTLELLLTGGNQQELPSDGQDWLPYPGPPGYISSTEALRRGDAPNLNPPQPPSGYKFAGWAPPPDGRLHDGSWVFENNKWLKIGPQPKVTWTHIRDPQLHAPTESGAFLANTGYYSEIPKSAFGLPGGQQVQMQSLMSIPQKGVMPAGMYQPQVPSYQPQPFVPRQF